jgi:DNA-binding HxlR family transcriptional regulator
MPYGTATELTEAGREVLFVIEVVERWLTGSPQGPIQIDSDAGKAALKALSEGWNSTMVRELADEPASLTELDRRIAAMSYPSLERRLSRMRSTRQVEPSPGDGRGQPFAVTDWLRHSVAPLCAAGRCERLHMAAASTPITGVEIEAAFLLALPLVPLPETANGLCVLSVLPEAMQNGDPVASPEAAGVTVQVESGTMVRCIPAVLENGPVWALGTPMAWLSAVIDGHFEGLRYGGAELQLAADLVNGLHLALFGE